MNTSSHEGAEFALHYSHMHIQRLFITNHSKVNQERANGTKVNNQHCMFVLKMRA